MAAKDLIVGVDLGGTRFRVCLANREGVILERTSHLTLADGGLDAVIHRLVDGVRHILDGQDLARVLGMGLGAPGPLDPWAGIVLYAPNMPGWRDVPLRDRLRAALGIPVYINNDANLGGLGELFFGAGRGLTDLVYITVSTGIGGGVIAGGRLLLGGNGLAGEIGHMVVQVGGPLCGCGNSGCLEAMASGTAIARAARAGLEAGARGTMLTLAQGALDRVDAAIVERAAREGDELAGEIMREAGTYLGIGIVNVIHLLDPQMVIVGGGVSRAGDLILGPAREVLATRLMPGFRGKSRLVASALGDDAGLMGAVALVLAESQA
ncbi:MAG: ROK family protein [Chloroflexota bacterium]